ncbi:putative glycoside hydrolase [Limnoglobus roseus]|uniref:Uncharacterized protein n=1 Tax=Limnoglobus roseus TaxID=2598579 RepID=A0A5C1ARE4_9BACT|nr:putative glycoside hydrolase [Limnoglobus roseus]QEL20312.1 hypothetical protein PX52LOC_07405 [Limnoglobus roseus]
MSSTTARRFVPHCAPLEARETPAVAFTESFDTSPFPFAPGGWQEWSSNGSDYAAVNRDHATSGQQALALYGTLGVQSRIWTSTVNPGDVSVQAYVLSDNPAPILLFARGAGLDTAGASYVGVTVGPVGSVSIVESIGGMEHVLASSAATQPIATTWLNVRVQMTGDQVSVRVQGANTSEFLAPDGHWQADAVDVLATAVSVQPSSGLAGIGRQSGPYGTGYVDDFSVFSSDATPVVVTPIPPPVEVPPVVTVPPVVVPPPVDETPPVDVSPPAVPPVVEVPPVVPPAVPPVTVPDVPPVVPPVTVPDVPPVTVPDVPPVVPPVTVPDVPPVTVPDVPPVVPPVVVPPTVPPAVPPIVVPPVVPPAVPPPAVPPTPVQHYTHIRLAELAYDNTPIGQFEKDLAANSIDLIVPNPKYFDTFEQVAPDSTKYLYSNVSNLYQDLLTNWLKYADAHGLDREAAFYHVSKATAFTGSSPSSQPVNWFWSVSRAAANGSGAVTDLTANARGGRNVGVTFGGTGEAVTLGFPDKFRELNVTLTRPPQAGWSGVWEYAAGTNAAGQTVWKTLPLLADGTTGLQKDGQITFDPPADWVASATAGSTNPLYAVRFRTTTGTAAQAPEAKTILGRDYVGANGKTTGTIPAFDAKADANGDGYLNDQEYANRRTGFDARFTYESRLFYPYYGQMRFITNPTSDGVKAWAADVHAALLAANPIADGIFMDNASGRSPVGTTPVLESTTTYSAQMAGVIQAIRNATPGKVILANTTGGGTDATGVTAAAGASLEEFLLRPNDANWSQLGDVANTVQQRLNAGDGSTQVILDSHPGSVANMTDPRTQIGTLSYYYLLADPVKTYLMIWGGYAPAAAWSKKWIPAATVDVGQPAGTMQVFAQGADPQNAKLTYKVFSREYDDALVLFKPRSYTLGQGTGTTDDATATTHQLNGNYRQVNADGTLGPVIQSITLRNGEGAVLMKA